MIRIRWGAVSLLAAGALLVPAAGAHACLVDSSGVENAGDPGSTNLNSGDEIKVIGERLGSEAEPGKPVTYSAYIREDGHTDALLTLADKRPVPANGRLAETFSVGDLGDRPRDLYLDVEVQHSNDSFWLRPRPFTYLKPTPPGPTDATPPAEQPANTPAQPPPATPTPLPADQPIGSTSPDGHGARGTGTSQGGHVHFGAHHGTPSEHRTTTRSHTHHAAPAVKVVVATQGSARRAAVAAPRELSAAQDRARSTAQADRGAVSGATAPRPERADDASRPSSVPPALAAAREQPLQSDVPGVLVVAFAATGVALLLRSRRRPPGKAAIVPPPLPPRLPAKAVAEVLTGDPPATKLPDPAEVEAELQELLAEHAAKTARETPRNGPLAGAR